MAKLLQTRSGSSETAEDAARSSIDIEQNRPLAGAGGSCLTPVTSVLKIGCESRRGTCRSDRSTTKDASPGRARGRATCAKCM